MYNYSVSISCVWSGSYTIFLSVIGSIGSRSTKSCKKVLFPFSSTVYTLTFVILSIISSSIVIGLWTNSPFLSSYHNEDKI